MNRAIKSALPFLAMASIVSAMLGVSAAQEIESGLTPETVGWEHPRTCVTSVPCVPLPTAVVLTGGARAHRRGPLPAAAVYLGPRAAYPGTLAPWGSLPPAFYAASYPLPYYAPAVVVPSPYQVGRPVAPDAMYLPASPQADLDGEKTDASSPPAHESRPSLSPPEAIPAPQPMDIPVEPKHESPQSPRKSGDPPVAGKAGSEKLESQGKSSL